MVMMFVKSKKKAVPPTIITVFGNAGIAEAADPNQVTLPAGILPGDVILLSNAVQGSGTPDTESLSGFTTVMTANVGIFHYDMLCKIADGSEGGTAIGAAHANWTSVSRAVAVIRGNNPIAGVSVGATDVQISTGNLVGAGAAFASTTPRLVIGAYASSGAISLRSMNPTKDAEYAISGNAHYLAWKIYNDGDTVPGGNVVIDSNDDGSYNMLGLAQLRFT